MVFFGIVFGDADQHALSRRLPEIINIDLAEFGPEHVGVPLHDWGKRIVDCLYCAGIALLGG